MEKESEGLGKRKLTMYIYIELGYDAKHKSVV
jgi:hypothetical protein